MLLKEKLSLKAELSIGFESCVKPHVWYALNAISFVMRVVSGIIFKIDAISNFP